MSSSFMSKVWTRKLWSAAGEGGPISKQPKMGVEEMKTKFVMIAALIGFLVIPVDPGDASQRAPSARYCRGAAGQGHYPPGCPPRPPQGSRPTQVEQGNRPHAGDSGIMNRAQFRALLETKVLCVFEPGRRACFTGDLLSDRRVQGDEVPVSNQQLIPLDREATWLRTAFGFTPVMIRRDIHTLLRFTGTQACPVGSVMVGARGIGPNQESQPLTGRPGQAYYESPEVQARVRQDDRRCRTYQRQGRDRIRVRYSDGEQRDFDLVDRPHFLLIANRGR